MSEQSSIPLCVDLDGTLVKEDLFMATYLSLAKKNLITALNLLWVWPLKGRAAFKAKVAAEEPVDLTDASFNQELIKFLVREHAQDRKIILVTANDSKIAQKVADYFGFFAEVIASDGVVNLKGINKANELTRRFGAQGFDYVGNDDWDIPVWKQARKVYVVAKTSEFVNKLKNQTKVDGVFNW